MELIDFRFLIFEFLIFEFLIFEFLIFEFLIGGPHSMFYLFLFEFSHFCRILWFIFGGDVLLAMLVVCNCVREAESRKEKWESMGQEL